MLFLLLHWNYFKKCSNHLHNIKFNSFKTSSCLLLSLGISLSFCSWNSFLLATPSSNSLDIYSFDIFWPQLEFFPGSSYFSIKVYLKLRFYPQTFLILILHPFCGQFHVFMVLTKISRLMILKYLIQSCYFPVFQLQMMFSPPKCSRHTSRQY